MKRRALSGQISDTDIRLLRIFKTVVESGGFTAAEIDLNISTSAISIAISDLESRLGLKLCQRGRAGFSLTDEGSEVYKAILRLLASLEDFKTQVNTIAAELKGELNIGITNNMVTMHRHMRVTNSLSAIKKLGPEVHINIHMMPPAEIEKSVLDGRLHVGVIPDIKRQTGLDYIDLYTVESRLYCGYLHPLFSKNETELTAELINQQHAVDQTSYVPLEKKALIQNMNARATTTDREGSAFLILSGKYLGFLPVHYAEHWVEMDWMKALMPQEYNFDTRYAAISRKGARPNLVVQTFLEQLDSLENDRVQPSPKP